MRLFLLLYVVCVLALNFRLNEPIGFYLALTAFPVTLYLLLKKPNRKRVVKQGKAEQHIRQETQTG